MLTKKSENTTEIDRVQAMAMALASAGAIAAPYGCLVVMVELAPNGEEAILKTATAGIPTFDAANIIVQQLAKNFLQSKFRQINTKEFDA